MRRLPRAQPAEKAAPKQAKEKDHVAMIVRVKGKDESLSVTINSIRGEGEAELDEIGPHLRKLSIICYQ
eukprot:scaffold7266_cov121-Skeletonema_marinoi.AAC.10